MSRESPESRLLEILRGGTLIALLAGAIGSISFVLRVGGRGSLVLMLLFVGWDLSPFAALVITNVISKRWTSPARVMLYGVMLVITLGSLSIYGYVAFGPPRPQPAFAFLAVPLASWLLIAIVVGIAALMSGKRSRRGGE